MPMALLGNYCRIVVIVRDDIYIYKKKGDKVWFMVNEGALALLWVLIMLLWKGFFFSVGVVIAFVFVLVKKFENWGYCPVVNSSKFCFCSRYFYVYKKTYHK